MSGTSQNLVFASLGVVALIALACIADLVAGVPFGGQTVLDIVFLLAAGLTAYMAVDCIRNS